MISRVADHCFWFGRYVERAESVARVLFVTRNLALDAELSPRQCWGPVLSVSGEHQPFVAKYGEAAQADGERVQYYLTWDESNYACIAQSVRFARENARSIREVLSLEVWEVVNELHLWTSATGRSEYDSQRYAFYRHVRRQTQLALGLLRSTMLHDTPMDFTWLGVLLERVGQTARILDVHHHALITMEKHQVVETALWLSLLRACSGFEPFMKRFQGRVTGNAVAAFLILEPQFPRSVRYCVRSAYERLCAIRPIHAHHLPGGQTIERLRVLDEWLAGLTPDAIQPDAVHDLLTHVVDEVSSICNGVSQEIIAYPPIKSPSQLPKKQSQTNMFSETSQSQSQTQSQTQKS